jgi:alkylhydroperoxidase/carboxymuconolactone decarboxylase family protein YurZ
MSNEYLPEIYVRFRDRFPAVSDSLDSLGTAADGAGPLDDRTRRLVKLALAIGSLAEGAVRSNVRRALQAGASEAEIFHVVALAISTCGFPSAVAALTWVEEVLAAPSDA